MFSFQIHITFHEKLYLNAKSISDYANAKHQIYRDNQLKTCKYTRHISVYGELVCETVLKGCRIS